MLDRLRISALIRTKRLFSGLAINTSMDFRRFIILGHPRTGSTLLHTYLNSHWNVLSHGDLIGTDFAEKLKTRDCTIESFLGKTIDHPHPAFIRAVGFKYFYQYDDKSWGGSLMDHVKTQGYRIIHLKRRDRLRTVMSYLMARETGHWSYRGNQPVVRLEPGEVIDSLEMLRIWEDKFDHEIEDQAVLTIFYEDLDTTPNKVLDEVQVFLQIPPRHLTTVLNRQHGHSLEGVVSNYKKIREAAAHHFHD